MGGHHLGLASPFVPGLVGHPPPPCLPLISSAMAFDSRAAAAAHQLPHRLRFPGVRAPVNLHQGFPPSRSELELKLETSPCREEKPGRPVSHIQPYQDQRTGSAAESEELKTEILSSGDKIMGENMCNSEQPSSVGPLAPELARSEAGSRHTEADGGCGGEQLEAATTEEVKSTGSVDETMLEEDEEEEEEEEEDAMEVDSPEEKIAGFEEPLQATNSIVNELIKKFGFNDIHEYQEAFRKALHESCGPGVSTEDKNRDSEEKEEKVMSGLEEEGTQATAQKDEARPLRLRENLSLMDPEAGSLDLSKPLFHNSGSNMALRLWASPARSCCLQGSGCLG